MHYVSLFRAHVACLNIQGTCALSKYSGHVYPNYSGHVYPNYSGHVYPNYSGHVYPFSVFRARVPCPRIKDTCALSQYSGHM